MVWLREYRIERTVEGECRSCDGGDRAQLETIPLMSLCPWGKIRGQTGAVTFLINGFR